MRIVHRLLLVTCTSALFVIQSGVRAQQTVHLTVLHTNDTHGHLLPYSYPDTQVPGSYEALLAVHHNIGGAARRGTLIKRIRAEKTHATLLIDAGDICDGTPFSTEYHGDADMAVMNAIGYDIACPGNHEFNNTLKQVQKLRIAARFPLLAANCTLRAGGLPLYTPYVIRVVQGVRIAFFGLVTYDAHTYPAAREGVDFATPVQAATKLVPLLRKQADLVIAVTHIGKDEDVQLAKEVPGIDVIVGGHSHTLLPQPIFVASGSGGPGTVIVQDFQWAGTLGRLDLSLQRDVRGGWSVAKYAGRLIPITASVPEAPEVGAVVARFWKPIALKYGRVVAVAEGDFTERGSDLAQYNLEADAVREATGADFDLENLGSVRAPIAKGAITYGDLVTVDPFNDTVVTFKITGANLLKVLARLQPEVSGIRYRLSGRTVSAVTIDGNPVEPNRVYSGATNSYFASTQGLSSALSNRVDTGLQRLAVLVKYVEHHSPLVPLYDGRRVAGRGY